MPPACASVCCCCCWSGPLAPLPSKSAPLAAPSPAAAAACCPTPLVWNSGMPPAVVEAN